MEHDLKSTQERIKKLECRVVWLYVAIPLVAIAATVLTARLVKPVQVQANAEPTILKARGLIIVDEQGRERILLGAPIPAAANRFRSDEKRVRELWAKRYPNPDKYMEYYKNYRHDMNGMLILDENGHDRVALGSPTPDPNIGRRIAPATGLEINDENGFERTGYGLLKVNDKYRVVLGLDSEKGREGMALVLSDEGRTGISVYDGERTLYLGAANPDSGAGFEQPFLGVQLRDGKEVVYQINARRPATTTPRNK